MKGIRKSLFIPSDIIKKIEEYQKENYVSSFTQAVVQLIIKGFELTEKERGDPDETIQSNRH